MTTQRRQHVAVLSPWAVYDWKGRTYHGQLEDAGIDGEKVLRTHWASKCPADTDCTIWRMVHMVY